MFVHRKIYKSIILLLVIIGISVVLHANSLDDSTLRPLPYDERSKMPADDPAAWTVEKIKETKREMQVVVHEIGAMLRHVDTEFNRADQLISDFALQDRTREFGDQFREVRQACDIWYYGQRGDPTLTPETAQQIGDLLDARVKDLLIQLNELTVRIGVLEQSLLALQRSGNSEELEGCLYLMVDQAYNARDRIDRFISTKKFDTAGRPVVCNINESIRRILVHFIETSNVGSVLDFRFSPSPSPLFVLIDQGLATEIWSNLITNAAEAVRREEKRRKKSGEEKLGMVDMEITTMQADNSILIIFADKGPGIPPEIRDRIFEIFFTTKEGLGGKGVGLALVREIIEKAGGTITVGPNNPGARFVIMLPTLPSPAQPPSRTSEVNILSAV